MGKQYTCSLFIFRRDLRLQDNSALYAATQESQQVIPCFIFDPRQVGEHDYKSHNALQFMIESLHDLQEQLKARDGQLYYFYGQAEEVVEKLLATKPIEAVYFNRDYTPFSQKRDKAIDRVCQQAGRAICTYDDALLQAPDTVLKSNGEPYTVFTPFYNKSQQHEVVLPTGSNATNFYTGNLPGGSVQIPKKVTWQDNEHLYVHGGRERAQKIVRKLKSFAAYAKTRDTPSIDTSLLSAHNKFGTISIRELYYVIAERLGEAHPLLRQLYWRDFYTQVAFFYPHVFGHAFRKEYDRLTWRRSKKDFERWCSGRTGFPIVDAGMRQLNTTGFMHNRVRMIVGSFLVKDLHIDWRWGERHFAQQLVDYDPAVNNGNWQWVASTGCDAVPYFRIFNPWTQQKKFDPQAEYIKRWVPELARLSAKQIHDLDKGAVPGGIDYPAPMVDHAIERVETLARYQQVRAK